MDRRIRGENRNPLESKVRDEHRDREREVEEKNKEGSTSSPAVPAGPSASGEAAAVPSTSTSKERGKQPPQTDGQKKARIATDDASKIQKRPRDQEADEDEKAARQDGMTDASTPGAASPNTIIAPSIPIGPNTGRAIKREADSAPNDDEAPEKVQTIMSICVGQYGR